MMRRISMVVLRETARHITRGLEIVGPQCVQKRAARRMLSSAAEADMDEFRAGIHNDRSAVTSAAVLGRACKSR